MFPGNPAALPSRLREGVAEFKFEPFELLQDIVRETKTWNEMRWLVCWEAKEGTRTLGGETMTINEVEPNDSAYVGVTHVATLQSAGEQELQVIALRPLLEALC